MTADIHTYEPRLGHGLPHDKRLRHLCEAVLADPTRHETLSA